jgi:HK97 gp10 family phage protein
VLSVEINDKTVVKRLFELEPKLRRKVLSQAVRAGANTVLPTAKMLAPSKSGRLRKSVKTRAVKAKASVLKKFVVQLDVRTQKNDSLFQGDTFYAGFIEYGWKPGKRLSGGSRVRVRGGRVPGRHFLERAYDMRGIEAVHAIERTAVDHLGEALT